MVKLTASHESIYCNDFAVFHLVSAPILSVSVTLSTGTHYALFVDLMTQISLRIKLVPTTRYKFDTNITRVKLKRRHNRIRVIPNVKY